MMRMTEHPIFLHLTPIKAEIDYAHPDMATSARQSQDNAERATLLSDTDTEAGQDEYTDLRKTRSSPRHRLKQYGSYAALVVLGALLGSLITKGISSTSRRSDDSDKHGPMVPPIYKLPPVRRSCTRPSVATTSTDDDSPPVCRATRHT